ncbi:MAG: hypothetical protein LBB78_11680 [Spirochaetaceae bacterium]|jgi:hypothetical protein|nr:hypothetical protein [Spirochaetaceae bacterium]
MKKYLLVMIFSLPALALFAQSRNDVTVYIPPVTGGLPEQQVFFAENFKMELMGANYAVVGDVMDSDYTLALTITQEAETYEDETGATVEETGEIINVLAVSLQDSNDGREVLQFSWAFNTLEEMYEWNLHLIYQAMANVPLTKLTVVPDTDHWRNKWLYIRASFDYPITFYASPEPTAITGTPVAGQPTPYSVLDHKVLPFPGITLGVEFQFLNWMSAEGDFKVNFGDPLSTTFIPAIDFQLKFPLKPSKHFMIEPYGMATFPTTTATDTVEFPRIGIGGGVQLGVKGGSMGAIFVDVNYVHYLGKVTTKNNDTNKPNPATIDWNRFSVGLGIGYKIGFFNRNKDTPLPKDEPIEEEPLDDGGDDTL